MTTFVVCTEARGGHESRRRSELLELERQSFECVDGRGFQLRRFGEVVAERVRVVRLPRDFEARRPPADRAVR